MSKIGLAGVHVSAIDMSRARDSELLEYALIHDFVIVTRDGDFHAMLARRRLAKPSIIWFRLDDLNGDQTAEMVYFLVNRFATELAEGAAITVGLNRIGFARLPFTV